MLKSKFKIIRDSFVNLFASCGARLAYIVEPVDWSIAWDGKQIVRGLIKQNLIEARVSASTCFLKSTIVHFGSNNTFHYFGLPKKSAKPVLTWFHFVAEDKRNGKVLKSQDNFHFIHTSCSFTKKNLADFGIDQQKIKVIPLGVDLDLFKPAPETIKQELKNRLGLPNDKFIVGSFQKDGVGWGEGLEPKLIKGPDVLIDVLKKLSKQFPIFVLLAGPSRGYVKNGLAREGIGFLDCGNLPLQKTAGLYAALDLYVVSSRIEGGPKAILESMASSVPVVSTSMGMAPDIKRDFPEFLMAGIEDSQGLADLSAKVLGDKAFALDLAQKQRKTAESFSWDRISQRYFNEMYSKLQ
ncbi:MAG: glycosyltransferase family 4 protein [Patescibacteria group bacterium]|nr:glycosyltransferase family 4 protein [Patescibacteria group bacterium]